MPISIEPRAQELARGALAVSTTAKTGKVITASAEQVRELHAQAEQDLTQALKLNPALSRAYLIRAELREQVGNLQGARSDRVLGMRIEPTDAPTWIDRLGQACPRSQGSSGGF